MFQFTVFLKRYGPLVGTFVLAASVVLRAAGVSGVAELLELLASYSGLPSVVNKPELVAAVAALAGVVLKIKAEIEKLRARNRADEPQ